MKRTSNISCLILLVATLFLMSCAPQSGGTGITASENDPVALELVNSIYERNQDILTLALRGEVNYAKGTDRWYFRFELISERPDSFLFTILDPMGQPAYRIFSDRSSLRALDYRQQIFYQGASLKYPLEAFLPIPLTAPDFLSLLSGLLPAEPSIARPQSPITQDAKVATIVYQSKSLDSPGPWRLQLTGGPGFQVKDEPTILSLARGPRNNPDFMVRYDKWGKHPREDTGAIVDFPEIFRANWQGRNKLEVRVAYTEIRLGFSMPQNILHLEQPDGFSIQLL